VWGLATAFSPRCPAAACGSRDKAPTMRTADDTPRSSVGRKLSVRKRTPQNCFVYPWEMMRLEMEMGLRDEQQLSLKMRPDLGT